MFHFFSGWRWPCQLRIVHCVKMYACARFVPAVRSLASISIHRWFCFTLCLNALNNCYYRFNVICLCNFACILYSDFLCNLFIYKNRWFLSAISPKSSLPWLSFAGLEPATYGLRNQSANQCTTVDMIDLKQTSLIDDFFKVLFLKREHSPFIKKQFEHKFKKIGWLKISMHDAIPLLKYTICQ